MVKTNNNSRNSLANGRRQKEKAICCTESFISSTTLTGLRKKKVCFQPCLIVLNFYRSKIITKFFLGGGFWKFCLKIISFRWLNKIWFSEKLTKEASFLLFCWRKSLERNGFPKFLRSQFKQKVVEYSPSCQQTSVREKYFRVSIFR